MSEGQSIEGRSDVRIAQIERERVLLDHGGVREQLVIVHRSRSPEEAANEPTPEVREYRRNMSDRLRALTDAGTHYRDVLEPGTREGLLAEGDVSPAYQDGEMIGVAFDGLKPGGVYERIGLRNGDVVTSIGGVSLGDPAATAKVLGAFASSDELSLSVERSDGSQETLSLSTADFEQAVQELQ
jgi:type II secretion system protein C